MRVWANYADIWTKGSVVTSAIIVNCLLMSGTIICVISTDILHDFIHIGPLNNGVVRVFTLVVVGVQAPFFFRGMTLSSSTSTFNVRDSVQISEGIRTSLSSTTV